MRRQDNGSDGGTEEGEVRVGALGGTCRAVWAVRLASSLVFVVVVLLLLLLLLLWCCLMCWAVTEIQKQRNSAVLASKDGAATRDPPYCVSTHSGVELTRVAADGWLVS